LAEKVTLASVGNGRYEGTFDGANVGGHYRIRVDYDWTDPRTGAIRRQQFAERQVPVRPSATDSVVQVQREPRATTALIVITPRDRFGNYVGPGFENQFNVRADGATVASVRDDELTGAYAIRLTGLAPGDDPSVRIDYGDQTLRDAPVSQLAAGGTGRYAVWLGLGSTFPNGSFSGDYRRDLAGSLGFEYALSATAAVEATLGFHQFEGKNGAPDLDVTQFGVNGKWYHGTQGIRPFVTLGIGGYSFDPGSTRFGWNVGVGAQFPVAPRWSLEGRYAFHVVAGNSPNSRYSTLLLGLRYAF
jgi:opacity protein-like surface antigen